MILGVAPVNSGFQGEAILVGVSAELVEAIEVVATPSRVRYRGRICEGTWHKQQLAVVLKHLARERG